MGVLSDSEQQVIDNTDSRSSLILPELQRLISLIPKHNS